ncbi:ABC transporter substrate-binding protein [Actinocrispum wychmicini]|uniref:ABC transporter substrate-binding protein n=1 Tax=Actinocrispum wychmicini TaxID=1213861 RepID=UPI001404EAFC|nr:ABC transporter substrate-binding protein [Actinocrispum wychmicini]
MKRKTLVGATALAMSAAMVAAGCSAGGQNTQGPSGPKVQEGSVVVDKDGSLSKGPAADVPGSRKGGNINVIFRQDSAHYDPAWTNSSPDQTLQEMLYRRLTMYKIDNGKKILVGDLATNTGETTDGGKTWKFTLKDGVKYADGSPISTKDIKYAVSRSFAPKFAQGFPYLQTWLADSDDFTKVYPGVYEAGKQLGDDKVETPDDKTIIFKFNKPRPDLPFAVELGTAVPVPQAKDAKDAQDQDAAAIAAICSGPYKVVAHDVDKSLKLVRNDKWDPASDAIRHQYADTYSFEFGPQIDAVTDRLSASAGDDKNSVGSYSAVAPAKLATVMNDPKLKQQVIDTPTTQVNVYSINNTRVTDINVRKALLVAFPKEAARLQNGGPYYGDYATTLGSPSLLGWSKYDLPGVTDVDPKGDPEKAKKMLTDAGKLGYEISLGYTQTPTSEKEALAVADGLEKGGFKVNKLPMQSKTFLNAREQFNNNLDLYWYAWAPDWPTGATVYGELYDGRKVGDGRPNNSHFKNDAVNSELDRIMQIVDPAEQGKAFNELDKKIMEQVPAIPYVYQRRQLMVGSNVGGGAADAHDVLNLNSLFLKS